MILEILIIIIFGYFKSEYAKSLLVGSPCVPSWPTTKDKINYNGYFDGQEYDNCRFLLAFLALLVNIFGKSTDFMDFLINILIF